MSATKRVFTMIAISSVVSCNLASAQSLVVPEKVISEPILWTGSKEHTSCGYRIHNMILKKSYVFDYDLQFILMVGANNSGKGILTTLVAGRVHRTLATAANPNATAANLRPTDLYIAIPGVPDIIKLDAIEPGADGTPVDSFTGFPVKESGGESDASLSARLMQAVVSREPILVSFVMNPSSTGTEVVRVVNNLTLAQEEAVTDCLDRQIDRARKLEK